MDEAERLCDRVAIVDHGKVIAEGTPRELIGRLEGDEVVEFAVADGATRDLSDLALLTALPGVQRARAQAGGFALTVSEVHVALPALLELLRTRGAAPTRLSTHHATLEDVFVELTGRQLRD
jgi:ABC-2 type transport system ATP-binding protein